MVLKRWPINVTSFSAYLFLLGSSPKAAVGPGSWSPWGSPQLVRRGYVLPKRVGGGRGCGLSLPLGISHLPSPLSFWPLPMMCIFPSAPASQTDSLPRQGSNFQNKTLSTKENITMERKTFQYQASWDSGKCTECLSENDDVLTSQTLLRAEGEQCLTLGSSQAKMAQAKSKLVLKLAQTWKSQMCVQHWAAKQTHCGLINILHKVGPGALFYTRLSSSPWPQRRCPIQACCLAKGQLASCLGSGKWLIEHIPHLIIVPPGVVQCLDPFWDTPGKWSYSSDQAKSKRTAGGRCWCQIRCWRRSKGYSRP